MANRLSDETSPYLLQHRDNPVDWYPWGEAALTRARVENKPILLSVGYSACHWCHVMAHESFESPEIARLMNENFVNIKVDREERPDLDQIYQGVAQAMTRGGGWPLTVFLTPDLKPFFGGTYFPPEDRHGRAGFPRVLEALASAYRNDPTSVNDNAAKLTEFIQSLQAVSPEEGGETGKNPSMGDLRAVAEEILGQVDRENGGVGGAPKFPNTMIFSFLWRLGLVRNSGLMKEASLLALEKMAKGGIYDQLGGGFHRYSVDESWSVPHFEKMLYDNGLLLRAFAEPLLSDDALVDDERRLLFRYTLVETVEYLLREMRTEEGAFLAAQDADSEGEEGKFFVWGPRDLSLALNEEEARVFSLRYGVTPNGNFEHGKTVLHQAASIEEVALATGLELHRVREVLAMARAKLFHVRSGRVAPGRDDKVLAGWNGLAISGLCWASQALRREAELPGRDADEPALLRQAADRAHEAARAAFAFVRDRLSRGEGRLYGTYQGGKPKLNAYLDDYAFLAMGALDLARISTRPLEVESCLLDCERWIGAILEHFKDSSGCGYFFTSDDHEALIHRPKTIFDQAIPSGTAVALSCMAALSEIDPEGRGESYASELAKQLPVLFSWAERNPFGSGELLCLALLTVQGPVVVSGPRASEAVRHPHVYQKPQAPLQGQRLLICHQRACGLPLEGPVAAWQESARKLGLAAI